MRTAIAIVLFNLLFLSAQTAAATALQVKPGKQAIVKVAPTGNAEQFPDRLPPGTKVTKLDEVPRYYLIRLADGRTGWSYKGNFSLVEGGEPTGVASPGVTTKDSLLARSDVLKIIIIDVEVGDGTLIICPAEDGKQDVILIDTGENDSDRIKKELVDNGFILSSGKPVTRIIISHYDHDHCGDAPELIPLTEIVYDHGDNNIKADYLTAVQAPGVDRRQMTLDYQETFSGGVSVECIAVNQATDFDPDFNPTSPNDNANSIALIISFDNFDYFTGGDLTKKAEQSLAGEIKNCDTYHVNHHGSRTTSSASGFVAKLDPEVSVASNGAKYGHPSKDVASRLIDLGSKFYQTNINLDSRAHQPDPKFVADDTYNDDNEAEELEGASGTIRIVVDPVADKYYVVMPGLPLSEATFDIEP